MNAGGIILVTGVVGIAAYLVITSTSQKPTDCSGDWTDYFNPVCWVSQAATGVSNEINTILIIVGAVIVIIIGLLAFGPQTQHIARGASALAVL